MTRDSTRNAYFEWMHDLVNMNRYSKTFSYRRLLMYLHNTPFVSVMRQDESRAQDGAYLRYRFASMQVHEDLIASVKDDLRGPCSVLEMMVALAIYCEESIMDDAQFGDRTGQWFWGMITSLGLGAMTDDRFDRRYVEEVVTRFLDRDYEPNGRGGLFTIKDCDYDLRTVEIQWQLCWYLNTIT